MTVEVKLTYENQFEAEEAMKEYETAKAARSVLYKLRDEIRSVCKYGEPTERDEFWYSRLFELAGEEDVSAWDF